MEQLKRDGRYLEEVFVTAKARIPDSKNLNEDGGADQTITQAVLEQTPKKTLFDLLQEKVPGFRRGTLRRSTQQDYFIHSNRVRFVFDGVDLNFFFNQDDQGPKMDDDYVQFVNSYIRYYAAEDVKGIEIMNSPAYNSSYKSRYLTTAEQINASPVTTDFSFVEITTYGGVGPFLKKFRVCIC
nr:Plug domain-containing protein [Niabella ginsengisoli]